VPLLGGLGDPKRSPCCFACFVTSTTIEERKRRKILRLKNSDGPFLRSVSLASTSIFEQDSVPLGPKDQERASDSCDLRACQ